jgi:hypothetical protein
MHRRSRYCHPRRREQHIPMQRSTSRPSETMPELVGNLPNFSIPKDRSIQLQKPCRARQSHRPRLLLMGLDLSRRPRIHRHCPIRRRRLCRNHERRPAGLPRPAHPLIDPKSLARDPRIQGLHHHRQRGAGPRHPDLRHAEAADPGPGAAGHV